MDSRRDRLEAQVRRRFLTQAAQRLGLDESQRGHLEGALRSGAEARRDLMLESRRLRVELMQAVRADSTPPATYEGLLDRLEALREREWELERREAAQLETFLDARQRAAFLIMRMHFNDQVRRMQGAPARGRGGPGGMPDLP
jgi:hypothetical protein